MRSPGRTGGAAVAAVARRTPAAAVRLIAANQRPFRRTNNRVEASVIRLIG